MDDESTAEVQKHIMINDTNMCDGLANDEIQEQEARDTSICEQS